MIRSAIFCLLLVSTAAADVRIQASPLGMKALRRILNSDKSAEIGRWDVILKNDGALKVDLTREDVILALELPVMTADEYTAVLKSKAGGKWPKLKNIITDAGYVAAVAARNSQWRWLALAGPGLDYLESRVTTHIPDVTPQLVDIPDEFSLAPGQGKTFHVWTSPIHQARVIKAVIHTQPAPPSLSPAPTAGYPDLDNPRVAAVPSFERARDQYFGA